MPLSVTTFEISLSEIFLSQTLFRAFRAFRVSAFSTLLYSLFENAESAEISHNDHYLAFDVIYDLQDSRKF